MVSRTGRAGESESRGTAADWSNWLCGVGCRNGEGKAPSSQEATGQKETVALRKPMLPETMELPEVARLLGRDAREVAKLASQGHLPGRRVGTQWRFSRAEITHWLEEQLPSYSELELAALEGATAPQEGELYLARYLPREAVAVPLAARTRRSALSELVKVAEPCWQLYDPAALLSESGVAIPHPRRPLPPTVQADSLLAYGRVPGGVPFGAPSRQLTDIFFLVSCADAGLHLKVLARLSRMLLMPGFLAELRASEQACQTWELLLEAERELVGG
jgi:PTS system nitrogen regulatory IIA component